MRRLIVISLMASSCSLLYAQLTYGVTGLLHAPSAEMQPDKTVMIGGTFLNEELTPPTWNYHTFNYYLNVTFFSWMEIAYTCTAFRMPNKDGKFRNQDRYFSLRLRALKEGQLWKYMPAVVVGTSDPYTSSGNEGGNLSPAAGNGYHVRFFVAATKHIPIDKEEVGIHVSYLYNTRKDYKLNGLAAGISYVPTCLPHLKVIAEYDTKDFAMGASYLLFDHLLAQVEMQRMRYFSGGLTYKIYLK